MNYIKDIELHSNGYNAIIEIPKGTKSKYELVDKSFDRVEEVRKIHYKYPFYYGCFPQTLADDKDPLDMILIFGGKRKILEIVEVTPVALVRTVDHGYQDDKIIVIPTGYKVSNRRLEKEISKVVKFLKIYKYPNQNNTILDDKILSGEAAKLYIEDAYKNFIKSSGVNIG